LIEFKVWENNETSNDCAAYQRSIQIGKHLGKIPNEWNEVMIAEYLKIFAETIIQREKHK